MSYTLSTAANHLKVNKTKLKNYLSRAQTLKINSEDTNTEAHRRCNIARDLLFDKTIRDDFIILQIPIELSNILPQKSYDSISLDILKSMGCGRFGKDANNNYSYRYEYLDDNIAHWCSRKKYVFIMFIMKEWCIVETKNTKTKRPALEYCTHSTCMLLEPKKKHYNAYYINSHGNDIYDYAVNFKRIRSSTRIKITKFEKPAELVLINQLIEHWQTLEMDDKSKLDIKWNNSKKHVYLGVNLQAGDCWGVCFIFPQVILHYIGTMYRTQQNFEEKWGRIEFNTLEKLLEDEQLELLVQSAFMPFNKNYRKAVIKHIIQMQLPGQENDLEKIIEKEQTTFIKTILCALVRYLQQISFKI